MTRGPSLQGMQSAQAQSCWHQYSMLAATGAKYGTTMLCECSAHCRLGLYLCAATMHMDGAVFEALMQAGNARLAPRQLPQQPQQLGIVLVAGQGLPLDAAVWPAAAESRSHGLQAKPQLTTPGLGAQSMGARGAWTSSL